MREHVLQKTDIEGMMGMVIATGMVVMVVAVAMAIKFCLESDSHSTATVMVMMGYNGMQHDYRTCHRNHYLCRQMLHSIDLISPISLILPR